MARFRLGRLLSTPGALERVSNREMLRALGRHVSGDWGTVCPEDAEANEAAVNERARLLSSYTTRDGVRLAELAAEATAFARDLINEPANHVTATALAEAAESIGKVGGLRVRVYDRAACAEMGMGAFLGVNQGSQEQARGMEQISRAVVQMEQLTQKTAASAEESASAGTELSSHAETLRGLVHQMREMVGAQQA